MDSRQTSTNVESELLEGHSGRCVCVFFFFRVLHDTQASGCRQCRVTEMRGQDALDTVWVIYKCFTLQGGWGAFESLAAQGVYHSSVT